MTEDRKLTPVDVQEITGVPRNQWSTRVSNGYVPGPDGYNGRKPWWWESTIRDFLYWDANPLLSRVPPKAERFAAWQAERRQWQETLRTSGGMGGSPLSVEQSDEDRKRGLETERHIRKHRAFTPAERARLTQELTALVPSWAAAQQWAEKATFDPADPSVERGAAAAASGQALLRAAADDEPGVHD